jgi:hypothetical protein
MPPVTLYTLYVTDYGTVSSFIQLTMHVLFTTAYLPLISAAHAPHSH